MTLPPINDSDDLRIGANGASSAWLNGVMVWPRGAVVGIDFVTADTRSGAIATGDQVFPSADGVVEFWREGGSEPRNWRATPKAGEARFAEYEFPNTYNAHADGGIDGRGTLQEIAGSPVIYNGRAPGSSGRVWKFNPVANTLSAVTAAVASTTILDVTVRDYADDLWFVTNETGTYKIRRRSRSSEGPTATPNVVFNFSTGPEEPESIDVDPDQAPFVAGRLDDPILGFLPYVEYSPPGVTWAFPSPAGYAFSFVDTIQAVGVGEAIGLASNDLSGGDDDFLSIFRFRVGEATAVDITDTITVDGIPYRTWAGTNADNILTQSGVKMAVLGESVAALTNDGTILLGTLIRS